MTTVKGIFTVWKISRAPIGKLHVHNPMRVDQTICGHVIPENAMTEYMEMTLEVMLEHGCKACAWLFFSETWLLWFRTRQADVLDVIGVTPGDQK